MTLARGAYDQSPASRPDAPASDEVEDLDDVVVVSRDTLRHLLEAADLLHEHWLAIADLTPRICGADAVDQLVEIGLVDADDLEVTTAFKAALQEGGAALGGGARPVCPPSVVERPVAGAFGE